MRVSRSRESSKITREFKDHVLIKLSFSAPASPLNPAKWDVPAPNFDETIDIDTEPINPRLR